MMQLGIKVLLLLWMFLFAAFDEFFLPQLSFACQWDFNLHKYFSDVQCWHQVSAEPYNDFFLAFTVTPLCGCASSHEDIIIPYPILHCRLHGCSVCVELTPGHCAISLKWRSGCVCVLEAVLIQSQQRIE